MELLADNALSIYTDGSMKQKPRRGGFGFRLVWTGEDGHEQTFDSAAPGIPQATNQEMELRALVEALKTVIGRGTPIDLARFEKIDFLTDSTYVHDHFDTAAYQWSTSGWSRSGGAPVGHAELWRELGRLRKRIGMPVNVRWIKGKSSGHAKAVDKLAKASADQPFGRPTTVRTVRRKTSNESVEPGSVAVEGQVIDIRIISTEYLRLHRCWLCKYEVMSEDSPYRGKVDLVYSDEPLRHRNIYTVRLNDHPRFPKIEEIIAAVPAADSSTG